MTLAVEAEPVDDALRLRQAEQARTRIARLRARRHGADLDEAESQREQRIDHLGVLVEPGCHTDRIGKMQAERLDRETCVRAWRGQKRGAQGEDRRAMRRLGIERVKEGPREGLEGVDHGTSPSKSCAPSRMGIGFAETMRAGSSVA